MRTALCGSSVASWISRPPRRRSGDEDPPADRVDVLDAEAGGFAAARTASCWDPRSFRTLQVRPRRVAASRPSPVSGWIKTGPGFRTYSEHSTTSGAISCDREAPRSPETQRSEYSCDLTRTHDQESAGRGFEPHGAHTSSRCHSHQVWRLRHHPATAITAPAANGWRRGYSSTPDRFRFQSGVVRCRLPAELPRPPSSSSWRWPAARQRGRRALHTRRSEGVLDGVLRIVHPARPAVFGSGQGSRRRWRRRASSGTRWSYSIVGRYVMPYSASESCLYRPVSDAGGRTVAV